MDGPERADACSRSPQARVAGAIRWLRENFTRPTRVEQLAAQAAMSVSTFHRHFKAATAMAPMQYQKQLRLLEARRLLLADGRGVAQAAFAVGYESPAQFSREYARLFGTPPVRDRVGPRHGA